VIVKLAKCRLLPLLPQAYGVPQTSFWVREKSEEICLYKLPGDTGAQASVKQFFRFCRSYIDAMGAPIASRIVGPGIDAGEAVMIGYLTANPDVRYLTTGDINCLRCLGASHPDVSQGLQGRIRCFEQSLLGCLGRTEQREWRGHLEHNCSCDSAQQRIVQSALRDPEFSVSVKHGLIARVKHIQDQTGDLLDLSFPPQTFA
ncbi:unnamed protein product, partial [Phaeothamnion confervicola]